MSVKFAPIGNSQVFDENGDPAVGWKWWTYLAGSSTPATTYTTSIGDIAQSNPVVLNSLGFPTTGQLWLSEGVSYKLQLTNAADVVKKTEDNIQGVNDATAPAPSEWVSSGLIATFVSTVSFTFPGDQTTTFNVGRRLKTVNTGGTIYSTITASVFTTLTTITVVNDSGVLDSGLSAVNYALLSGSNPSVPPFTSTSIALQDSADKTKRIRFADSGLPTATTRTIDLTLLGNAPLFNGTLVATVGASALTIALKTISGADPSGGDPVFASFRNATVGTGDNTVLTLVAASSLVVSSGSTLGTTNSIPFKLWIVGFNDAGTFRLGVINTLSGTNIYPLGQFPSASSTAEGGAGAADSAQVFYTGTAVSAKAYVVLGYLSFEGGLATAGAWTSVPTRIQLYSQVVPLPGMIVQTARTSTGAVATGTTTIPEDDTIPQITEGNEYITQAITPGSTANLLRISFHGIFASSAATQDHITALFQDAVANALAAVDETANAANAIIKSAITHMMIAGTTSSTTFRVRHGGSAVGTTTFNGIGGARFLGGVFNSYLFVEELMT